MDAGDACERGRHSARFITRDGFAKEVPSFGQSERRKIFSQNKKGHFSPLAAIEEECDPRSPSIARKRNSFSNAHLPTQEQETPRLKERDVPNL
jgi:hypothetical protein